MTSEVKHFGCPPLHSRGPEAPFSALFCGNVHLRRILNIHMVCSSNPGSPFYETRNKYNVRFLISFIPFAYVPQVVGTAERNEGSSMPLWVAYFRSVLFREWSKRCFRSLPSIRSPMSLIVTIFAFPEKSGGQRSYLSFNSWILEYRPPQYIALCMVDKRFFFFQVHVFFFFSCVYCSPSHSIIPALLALLNG